MASNHFVYIIECNDGSLYTGYTPDVAARLKKHEAGKGAKYTRGRGPFVLRYQEVFETKEKALQQEYKIKRLTKGEKLKLIDTYRKGEA